ncbi:MAG: SDR family oxidoreductase [Myxococcota bacterium]
MTHATTLITGAGRGLGRALALALARPGARLGLIARTPAELASTRAEAEAKGAAVHTVALDLGDVGAIPAALLELVDRLGPVDTLIHNASTLGPTPLALLADTAVDDFARAFAVNVIGPFALTKPVLGSMLLRQQGTVVAISSDAAVSAYPSWGAYAASKAAFDHLGRVLIAELEGTGLRFLSIDPGEMDTAMHRDAMPEADPSSLARPERVASEISALIQGATSGRYIVRGGA